MKKVMTLLLSFGLVALVLMVSPFSYADQSGGPVAVLSDSSGIDSGVLTVATVTDYGYLVYHAESSDFSYIAETDFSDAETEFNPTDNPAIHARCYSDFSSCLSYEQKYPDPFTYLNRATMTKLIRPDNNSLKTIPIQYSHPLLC